MLNKILEFTRKHSAAKIDAFAKYHEEYDLMYNHFYNNLNNCKRSIYPSKKVCAIPKEEPYYNLVNRIILNKKAL